jgi:hypothetical protein
MSGSLSASENLKKLASISAAVCGSTTDDDNADGVLEGGGNGGIEGDFMS